MISVKIIHELNIKIVTEKRKTVWIDDPEAREGGYHQNTLVPLKDPRINVHCLIETDEPVILNATYIDENKVPYRCVSGYRLWCVGEYLSGYSLPTQFTCVASSHPEGSKNDKA